MTLKRIFLDQNKWIDLGRASHCRTGGERFTDALVVAESGVDMGLLSFPLSASRYMEIHHRNDWESRHRLARVMADLSRFHTIAPWDVVVDAEIATAFHDALDLPGRRPTINVFGQGLGHAFAREAVRFEVPHELGLPPEDASELSRAISAQMEFHLLAGPPTDYPVPWMDTQRHRRVYERDSAARNEILQQLANEEWNKGDRLQRFSRARAIMDIMEPLNRQLEANGAKVGDVIGYRAPVADGLTALLEAIPSQHALSELERTRFSNPQQTWEPNDLVDITDISLALVYCDVLVTERKWVSLVRRTGLGQRHATRVIHDVADLPEVLVSL